MDNKHIIGLTIITIALALMQTAFAGDPVRVAVAIDFPDNETKFYCITSEEGTNAYELLSYPNLNISWSTPGPWGHGLCNVNDIGCPTDNCFCDGPGFWGFYIKNQGQTQWSPLLVSMDGGETCNEHYCAKEGDLIGLVYNNGSEPGNYSFNDICPTIKTKSTNKGEYEVEITPEDIYAGDEVTVRLTDEDGDGIKDVEIEITGEGLDITDETNRKGEIEFTVPAEGTYKISINARGYEDARKRIYVEALEKEEPTTTTTQKITTTTLKETTTTQKPTTTTSSTTETTTTTTSTTTTTQPKTTTTRPAETSIIGNVISYSAQNSAAISILILLVVFLYGGYTLQARKKKK